MAMELNLITEEVRLLDAWRSLSENMRALLLNFIGEMAKEKRKEDKIGRDFNG